MISKYKYTEKELKEILKSIVIITDSREKENSHILNWFDEHEIKHEKSKMNAGDYGFYLPANEKYGILRNSFYTDKICIERKANIDELIGNFSTDRNRIEDEFLRYQGNMTLLVEDGSYSDIRNGNYRSKYNSKSAIGTLHSFSVKYNVPFVFINKEDSGCYIYCSFYYYLRSTIV